MVVALGGPADGWLMAGLIAVGLVCTAVVGEVLGRREVKRWQRQSNGPRQGM